MEVDHVPVAQFTQITPARAHWPGVHVKAAVVVVVVVVVVGTSVQLKKGQ